MKEAIAGIVSASWLEWDLGAQGGLASTGPARPRHSPRSAFGQTTPLLFSPLLVTAKRVFERVFWLPNLFSHRSSTRQSIGRQLATKLDCLDMQTSPASFLATNVID